VCFVVQYAALEDHARRSRADRWRDDEQPKLRERGPAGK
jgi:hypothetical protein